MTVVAPDPNPRRTLCGAPVSDKHLGHGRVLVTELPPKQCPGCGTPVCPTCATILDPFAGSGTTGAAAVLHAMDWELR